MDLISLDLGNKKANCMVCGNEVEYLSDPVTAICQYCGVEEEGYFKCKGGHYVCNSCHSKDAVDVIKNVCLNTDLVNPMQIAEALMLHPSIHMHGPEHHALIPAVLTTAYLNYVGKNDDGAIIEAIERGKKVPGGYCGLYGVCGGGTGVGITVSIILGATPLTPEPRSHAMWSTSCTLMTIADSGGARCCKKAVRISLEEGTAYISRLFDINWSDDLDLSVVCDYTEINKRCDVTCKYRA
ncbi:DUF5714 domain-containing protein [Methanolobus sp. ZRKC3]|uniref:DUF5714 domain-containing protein n=1 Tax=Methanolobus sp. ZRKC3 TaxID=3125786 RepID=UPI00324D2E5F